MPSIVVRRGHRNSRSMHVGTAITAHPHNGEGRETRSPSSPLLRQRTNKNREFDEPSHHD